MSNHLAFRVYRYQLLPLDRNKTKDLFQSLPPHEIIERKNEFFAEAVFALNNLKGHISRVLMMRSDLYYLQLAPSRPLTRETPNFQLEKVENWPHILAYILNDPREQFLLIQDRASAFASTDTVANLIKKGTRHTLEKLGLSLHIEPLFDKTYFWNLIQEYKNRITSIEFEFILPIWRIYRRR